MDRRVDNNLNHAIAELFSAIYLSDSFSFGSPGLDENTKARLKRGLTSSEVAYLLGVENIVKSKQEWRFSWLNGLRSLLWASRTRILFNPQPYLDDEYRSQIFNRACARLAKKGTLKYASRGGKWGTKYLMGLGILDSEETISRLKKEMRENSGDWWSSGSVTLIGMRRMVESGFPMSMGNEDTAEKMANDIRRVIHLKARDWLKEWEHEHNVSLFRLMQEHDTEMDRICDMANKHPVSSAEWLKLLNETSVEFSKKFPRFPLVVVDLDFQGELVIDYVSELETILEKSDEELDICTDSECEICTDRNLNLPIDKFMHGSSEEIVEPNGDVVHFEVCLRTGEKRQSSRQRPDSNGMHEHEVNGKRSRHPASRVHRLPVGYKAERYVLKTE